jgi:hypothetical protein
VHCVFQTHYYFSASQTFDLQKGKKRIKGSLLMEKNSVKPAFKDVMYNVIHRRGIENVCNKKEIY